jgi:two-component system, HptB-dependent secretion and biofilm response regulator
MPPATHPTVLVADSYEDTRFMLKYWLEAEGYGVVEAGNGQEAVELTRGRCPDLLLMSERMPVLDGLEAARRIRRQDKECGCPIVAMSSYPTKEAQAAALAAGCDSFVAEPIDFDLLSNLLSHLLPGAAGRRPPECG